MWSIANEDPLGIVQIVQPEGSYIWDGSKIPSSIQNNLLSEWCGSGISQKQPPRDSTKSTDLGGCLLGMCR